MLSPAPPPAFQPQLKSDYFFNDDPGCSQSPLQLPLTAAPAASASRTASAASSPRHAQQQQQQQQQQQKLTEPRYYYVGDEDEEEAEKPGGAAAVTRSIDARSKERTSAAAQQQHESDPRLAADWSGGRKSSPPAASHTQPLTSSLLPHDSSTGSDSPSSPIPQPKPVRGSPLPNAPASSVATSSSSSPQQQSASASASVPSPVPFRPQSGSDGNVEYVGPFILGRVLGRGCTGTVRLGTHVHTAFEVAFKIIDKRYLNSDMKLWKKVKREIAILKLIEHPHVLKLYDVLETEQRLYLVLEHVRGGELFDYIVSKGRLDRDESLRLTAQIVMGLEHCHQHSICHRDLKPENLLLDDNAAGRAGSHSGAGPVLKIADFGMAQLMKNNAILKTSCGSPHYASPEIIEGQTYDARVTDVWSIGVILYALITGSLPFDHDNIPTLLSMVTKGHYTTPAHVPSDVSHLISRMLTVDPKKRIRLSEIRRHPCYKGTSHFVAAKSSTWPYSSGESSGQHGHHRDGKKQRRSNATGDAVLASSPSSSSDSSGSEDSSSEGEQAVDDSVLTDLEALGLDLNGNRDELVQKIRQRQPAGGEQENIERVFYRLLKKRRNSRLEQLSVLSPKISPRHFQSAATGGRLFTRAYSEPDVPYQPLDGDGKQHHAVAAAGAPSSRALSAAAHQERIPPPVAGMAEGEWVRSVHGSSSTATTEGNSSTVSQASTGSNRIPISPLALDDEREAADDYSNAYSGLPPPQHRQMSAPSPHTADARSMPPAPGGVGPRETSAASYYNRMVARSAAPMSSMSVPPSPYRVPTSPIVASAPSSPIFSASPHSMSPASASAPYATSVMKQSADAYPSNEYIAAEPSAGAVPAGHRHAVTERRGSAPSTTLLPPQIRMRAASATSTPNYAPDGSVARRLFIAEEKQADVDAADALETDDFLPQQQPQHQPYHHYSAAGQQSRRSAGEAVGSASSRPASSSKTASPEQSSPEWATTPRFHRVRFNPSEKSSQTASASALLSGSGPAPVSPVAKRSWFSSIFSRRPSLDLFSKSGKLKKPLSAAPAAGPPRAVTGVYSVKPMLTIADEVRRALKAAGIRYVVKKGDSNGASLFECEVGAEEEKEQEERQQQQQQPPLGMRFLARRKSTTAIDPMPHAQGSGQQQQQLDVRTGNRRASIGSAVLAANMSRTAPIAASADVGRLPLSGSPEQRRTAGGASAIPTVPRHAAAARGGRAKSPDDSLAVLGERESQSGGSTPRNAAAVAASSLSSSVPNHTRHYSLRSPPLTTASAGNSRPSSPNKPPGLAAASSLPVAPTSGFSLSRRPRANSNDGAVDDTGSPAGGSAAAPPAVKLIVEITSHHSNDLRCVRFLHVSGDEAVYRQVQNDIQQRLRL